MPHHRILDSTETEPLRRVLIIKRGVRVVEYVSAILELKARSIRSLR